MKTRNQELAEAKRSSWQLCNTYKDFRPRRRRTGLGPAKKGRGPGHVETLETLNKALMKKCLDLHALVETYEGQPVNTPRVPAVMRHGIWLRTYGRAFEGICMCCCMNTVNVFSFHCAHVTARSKGGATHPSNLRAVCAECNLSMGARDLDEFKLDLQR
jgi:5-methylcytosine-specific restriction endonuclease McrA